MPDPLPDLTPEFIRLIETVTGKREKIVIAHIREHGSITTEELRTQYGYDHLPRAIKDVRDQGVPLERFSVKSSTNRTIAAYRFGNPARIHDNQLDGRKTFPKKFKLLLLDAVDNRCGMCGTRYESRYFQIDYRVPYGIAGEVHQNGDTNDYMLLCASCNRAKSWSCEHCVNWRDHKSSAICNKCYWANPQNYEHVAMQPIRRLEVVWSGDDVINYERVKALAETNGHKLPEYIKLILAQL